MASAVRRDTALMQPSLRSRSVQIFVVLRDEARRLFRLRVRAEFERFLNEMTSVQIGAEKYFCFVFAENMVLSAIPPRAEGRTRRHDTWGWAAMDAAAVPDERSRCGRRSRVVLASRR
ncbi:MULTISPECIES: hypothetical protein [unclassified Bradyrhizobium]|uniref:hypothetical protein n=1 Tax=unclassified Bradyrhizobium TaxID=2631580 RepID=UPI0028ED8CC9|nr:MULTISPECIES: hypothetical protein [unclassified Bradyrhizobium]